MTVLNNYGRIIVASLITLILKLIYAEAYYLKNIDDNGFSQKLNNIDFNSNINNDVKLINRGQFEKRELEESDDDMLPYGSRDAYLIVMITSYLVVYLNFVGTSYVLYRSFYRWKYTRNTLPMALRVPMYIALTDSLFMISHVINISRTATSQRPWEGASCKLVGGASFFFQCMNIFLVGGVAITTLLRVKNRCFSLGKYDYKLFTGMFILSFISSISFIGNYGTNKYWCGGDYEDVNLAIFSLCLISLVTTVSLICYISIIRELRSLEMNVLYFTNENLPEEIANQRKETNKRIYSKISSYILIFIIQYIPVTIYNVGHIVRIEHYWIYVVCDIGLNFGGIGNFVQYTINEGWSDKPDDSDDAYRLNLTNFRIHHANRGMSSNYNNNTSNLNNQDFVEAIDSFGIIRPSPANTARQKPIKKVLRPRFLS